MDEIADYQNARYVSSNEAAWRILEFPIHERDPPVQQLAVHLENGQHVYFTEDTAMDRAAGDPPNTTLTEFFVLCRWMTFPRLCCMWMSPSITHEVTSLGTEENKAQLWPAFQVSKKHVF